MADLLIEQNIKFNLHSNCIPVKGIKRSALCDLQSRKYYLIPNGLYDILINLNKKTVHEVKKHFEHANDAIIDEYFIFLQSNNLIFFENNCDQFPALEMQWDEPNMITNAILDINDDSSYELKNVFMMLEELQCQHIQIRHYNEIDICTIEKTMDLLHKSYIAFVDWIIPYNENFDETDSFLRLRKFIEKFPRIFSITFYNYSKKGTIFQSLFDFGSIYSTTQKITDHSSCGNINENLFHLNIRTFTESMKYNTCLNRKISIDVNGQIKNCPSMSNSYGNISETSLMEAVKSPYFKKTWHIHKEQIDVCKSCEFRHICTDCRAYIEEPENVYSKPLKCGYDPNTCTWSEWSHNKIKCNAIEYYKMTEF